MTYCKSLNRNSPLEFAWGDTFDLWGGEHRFKKGNLFAVMAGAANQHAGGVA